MRKRGFALLLALVLAFSWLPTAALATGTGEESGCTVTAGCVLEAGHAGDCVTQEAESPAEEPTQAQETAAEVPEQTEAEDAEEVEDTPAPTESEETKPLLVSAAPAAEAETETLCDHGNDAESCAVCDLEEQIAALPTLEEIQIMTGDEEEAVYAQASALADVYYDDLTEDEQAQVSNIDTLWDVLDYFSSALTLTALTAVSADTSWYNNTATSFTLYDAADLVGLASLVNAGNDFSGKTIKLGNNINLNSESWTPIGTTSNPFKGTFDGQGYTVQNLSVSGTSYAGLFGYADGSAVIKNVTVTGSVSGTSYVGGVVGRISSEVTVENCTNSASVSVSGSSTDSYVGGIVGRNYGTVSNCSNTGNVSGGSRSYVGGITGRNDNTVSNCSNINNKVENSNSSYYTGGIVGNNSTSGIVSNSYNTGSVSGISYVGGVVGGNTGTLSNSYNTGAVSGTSYVGGVVGGNAGTLSNNYYLSDTANTVAGQTAKTAAQFASGEVAYLLNGSSSGGTTWYQNLDNGKTVDSYPVLSSSSGKVYYGTNCAGTAIYSNSTVPAATHSLTHVDAKTATCTEAGNDAYWYCSVCDGYFSNSSGTETTTLNDVTNPATGHNYDSVVTAPTCTENGFTTYTCSVCGDSYTANETEATGHTWDNGTVTTAATCTEDGEKTYTCTVCGETYIEAIAAAGHSLTHVEAQGATCTADGNIEYWYCSECGKYFSDSAATTEISQSDTVLALTSHSYGSWYSDKQNHWHVCAQCGEIADQEAHSFGAWTVTKEPTATATGLKTRTCSVCGYTQTRRIAATGSDNPKTGGPALSLLLPAAALGGLALLTGKRRGRGKFPKNQD